MALVTTDGFRLWPGRLDLAAQRALLAEVLSRLDAAPPRRQITPGGRAMSVEMSNFGPLGWVTDLGGYRYEATDPVSGRPWPSIPAALVDLWSELACAKVEPDACLVNLYRGAARMGLHQDRDEADFGFPVFSVSLGDTAVFRISGGENGASRSVRLASGDVCLLGGPARLARHGVDRILAGSSSLIPGGGRINLTLRRARPAPAAGPSPRGL